MPYFEIVMNFDQAVELYHEQMQSDERFQKIYSVAKMIMVGEHWLLGGGVFRPLVEIMYGRKQPLTDFDFVCEDVKNDVILPGGYRMVRNSHGNPKIINHETDFDCVPFNRWDYGKDLTPGINHVLIESPTTIQSIAYNPLTGKIKGLGKIAIQRQEIQINNIHLLLEAANAKGITCEDYLKKFDDLSFKLVPGYLTVRSDFPDQIEYLC